MAAYLIQRLWQSALVLLAVSVLSFVLIFLSGDPVAALIPLNARQEDVDNIRRQYNLDQPVLVQYLIFLQKAATGDMGESFKFRTDALGLVLGRLPNTMLLACSSMLLSMLISIPVGILAASYKGRLPDAVSSTVALLGISMPSFWLGVILILVFAGSLRLLPASGSGTWKHLVLPTITVSAFATGLLIRLVRRSVADALGQAYVMTARSKGLSERAIAWTHVLRNSAIPVVTVMGLQFGALLGGSVVVETVFAWPGVGWLMIQSIEARDLPVIRAAVLILALFIVLINLTVDLLYTLIDPRIKLGARPE
ncbi:MAG TPA: ABC transporter permease [Chloroflexota bacterium]|nr:ABC transporter permease [Chloroflexota bacterium]